MSAYTVLVKDIAHYLLVNGLRLVTVESCTGGLISYQLTEMAGSSKWFERGYVTYSNASKEELLKVPRALIETYGVVSVEVAQAMALGALDHSGADISLSVTGIAGPDGGSVAKPVGTVCFGWAGLGISAKTEQLQLSGSRHEIRMAACRASLEGLLDILSVH